MSLASRLFILLAGLALIWFFWPFGGDSEVVKIVEPPPSGHQGRLFTTPLPEGPAPKKPDPPKPAQAAPESGSETVASETDGDGDRVAAVPPDAAQQPKQELKPKLFYRVLVRDGGTLQSGNTVITLDGIAARDADALCKDANGRKWACGKQARIALMRLIRGRAVRCRVPASGKDTALTARCDVGGTDLSVWMVHQGWVKPKAPADAKLAKAADAAREKKIGVWR